MESRMTTGNSFVDFLKELEKEAKIEGPEAEAQLETLRQEFRKRAKQNSNGETSIELTYDDTLELVEVAIEEFGFKKKEIAQ